MRVGQTEGAGPENRSQASVAVGGQFPSSAGVAPTGVAGATNRGGRSSQACAVCASLSAVERREAQAPTSLGPRVSSGRFRVTGPAQRAGGPLARVCRGCRRAPLAGLCGGSAGGCRCTLWGFASPWRLPALHPLVSRDGKRERAVPAPFKKTKPPGGEALASEPAD